MSNATASAKSTNRVILSPDMTVQQAMAHVASGAVPVEAYLEWDAERVKLIESRARSASAGPRALSCKVSEKGGLSVYGLQARFPVTLYAGQWEKLAQFMPTLIEFIKRSYD